MARKVRESRMIRSGKRKEKDSDQEVWLGVPVDAGRVKGLQNRPKNGRSLHYMETANVPK